MRKEDRGIPTLRPRIAWLRSSLDYVGGLGFGLYLDEGGTVTSWRGCSSSSAHGNDFAMPLCILWGWSFVAEALGLRWGALLFLVKWFRLLEMICFCLKTLGHNHLCDSVHQQSWDEERGGQTSGCEIGHPGGTRCVLKSSETSAFFWTDAGQDLSRFSVIWVLQQLDLAMANR